MTTLFDPTSSPTATNGHQPAVSPGPCPLCTSPLQQARPPRTGRLRGWNHRTEHWRCQPCGITLLAQHDPWQDT